MEDLADALLDVAVVAYEVFSFELVVVDKTVAVSVGNFGHTFVVIYGVHRAAGFVFLNVAVGIAFSGQNQSDSFRFFCFVHLSLLNLLIRGE